MLCTQSDKLIYWSFLSFDTFDVFLQPYFFAINLYHFRIILQNIEKSIPVARCSNAKTTQHKVAKKTFNFILIQVHENRQTLVNYFERAKCFFLAQKNLFTLETDKANIIADDIER